MSAYVLSYHVFPPIHLLPRHLVSHHVVVCSHHIFCVIPDAMTRRVSGCLLLSRRGFYTRFVISWLLWLLLFCKQVSFYLSSGSDMASTFTMSQLLMWHQIFPMPSPLISCLTLSRAPSCHFMLFSRVISFRCVISLDVFSVISCFAMAPDVP